MMGDGRMVSPPLAEGGEPIVVPESLTFTGCHRMPQQGRTSRHALSRLQNCATRDIWYGRFPLHTFTLLSLDGLVDVALESWVCPCWWDLWFRL